jgi:D-3-phosphoglycerate dehydrogenase / 2-oxoglutarate reductase
VIPQGHLLLVRNDDTPGVVGHIGTLLGEKRVNIARMAVGRKPGSGRAVMLIEVDSEVPAEVVKGVAAIAGVREARGIHLG